jgi:hypothetical protein
MVERARRARSFINPRLRMLLLWRLASQRDCLTDPSPGPLESARQISATCSPKLYATVSSIISNTDRQLIVRGGRFFSGLRIYCLEDVAEWINRVAKYPGSARVSRGWFRCLTRDACGRHSARLFDGKTTWSDGSALPNGLRQTSFANEVAPKRDRATRHTYSSVG